MQLTCHFHFLHRRRNMAPFLFSIEQRVFIFVTYCATGSSNQVQSLFCREFPRSRVPYRSKIIRNVLEYGISTNMTACRNNCPNISKTSFNLITKIDLRWHPYRRQIRHQLREVDAERRVQYSQWLLGKPQAFMSQIMIGDEAIFQLNGNVSNHNVVVWN